VVITKILSESFISSSSPSLESLLRSPGIPRTHVRSQAPPPTFIQAMQAMANMPKLAHIPELPTLLVNQLDGTVCLLSGEWKQLSRVR